MAGFPGWPDTRPVTVVHSQTPGSRASGSRQRQEAGTLQAGLPPVASGNTDAPAVMSRRIGDRSRRGVGATRLLASQSSPMPLRHFTLTPRRGHPASTQSGTVGRSPESTSSDIGLVRSYPTTLTKAVIPVAGTKSQGARSAKRTACHLARTDLCTGGNMCPAHIERLRREQCKWRQLAYDDNRELYRLLW